MPLAGSSLLDISTPTNTLWSGGLCAHGSLRRTQSRISGLSPLAVRPSANTRGGVSQCRCTLQRAHQMKSCVWPSRKAPTCFPSNAR